MSSKTLPPDKRIASSDPLEVARALSDMGLNAIRADRNLGGEEVVGDLTKLRDAIWTTTPSARKPFDAILKKYQSNPAGRAQLLEGFARLGHLYEIGSLIARQNFLKAHERETPLKEWANKYTTADDALKSLQQSCFEIVMTQHPTNTNSLESMQAQRAIGIEAEKSTKGETNELAKAVETFFRKPLLHREKSGDGRDINFTVRDETGIVLNYLSNIYDDLPRVYAGYDDALKNRFPGFMPLDVAPNAYDPLKLQLNLKLSSWGSAGDKDGNGNVSAESTLEAIALHKSAILHKYADDLQKITAKNPDKELSRYLDIFQKAAENLENNVIQPLQEERKKFNADPKTYGKLWLKPKAFDNMVEAIHTATKAIPAPEDFRKSLTNAYAASSGEPQTQLLSLLRRFNTFGFTFGKIEYRETASEYERVVGMIAPEAMREDYTPKQRKEALEGLMQINGEPAKLLQVSKSEIWEGAYKPYTKEDTAPIAYHTIRRMELAREFPEMIENNVLAECKGALNLLEAQFLQKAVSVQKNGQEKRPVMGIIPLFEDPETMQNVTSIMQEAYNNKTYQGHLALVKQVRGAGNLTQQVQIAHSDNARRSGLIAARGFIHKAHKDLRKLHASWNQQHPNTPIDIQFFEGGSVSDAYRNGTRAISATVNAFDLHDFAKFTFQGGDLLNFFNQPSSIERLLTRNVSHMAGTKANGNGKSAKNDIADDAAIEALTHTLTDYEDKDFEAKYEKMGTLLAALDYEGETCAGNVGSRVPKREGFAPGAKIAMGALIPVPVLDIRTIAFSESMQHNALIPSWVGADQLHKYIQDAITNKIIQVSNDKTREKAGYSKEEAQDFITKFKDVATDGLQAKHLQALKEMSPAFSDAMDRAAYGISLTNMELLESITDKKLKAGNASPAEESRKALGRSYVDRLKETYRNVASLAWLSQEKSSNRSYADLVRETSAELRQGVSNTLTRIKDILPIKSAYRDFLIALKQNLTRPAEAPDNAQEQEDYWHLRKLIHNAGDTVVHGRVLPADDPKYGELLERTHHPQGPDKSFATRA